MPKSKAFLFVLLAFLLGAATASFFNIPETALYASLSIAAFLMVTSLGYQGLTLRKMLVIGACIFVFLLGIVRYESVLVDLRASGIHSYNDMGEIVFQGAVVDDPDVRENNTRYVVETELGKVLVFAARYPAHAYGDLLNVTGELTSPEAFDSFDYPGYLAKDDIYSLSYYPKLERVSSGNGNSIKKHLFDIKHAFERNIELALPEPQAAFLKGLLLGSRSGIPEDVQEQFRITGTTHIVALSGFNITIIAESLARMLQLASLGPSLIFWIASTIIVLFVLMTGASASIVRAGIMGILILIARKEGRQYLAVNALLFAGSVMVFENPKILRYDPAFQLSFLATLGLIYIAPRLDIAWKKVPVLFGVKENLITTLAAQLAVLPLIAYYFGSVSLISPVTNVLILAAIPFTMFFGFIAALAGFLNTGLSVAVGAIAYVLLSYQLSIVDLCSRIPFANIFLKGPFF